MRRVPSLLALSFLLASALAPAAHAQSAPGVQLIGVPLCLEISDNGQVQCSGAVAGLDRGGAPARAQVTVPYHCEVGGLRKPPALATGQSEILGGDNIQAFQVTTPLVRCASGDPPMLGTQISLRIYQGDQVVLQQNLRVNVTPPPQQ